MGSCRRPSPVIVGLAVGAALVGGACGLEFADPVEPSDAADGPTTGEGVAVAPTAMLEIVDEVNAYWVEVSPDFGFEFEPVPDRRIAFGTEGPRCDGRPPDPEDVEDNAYVESGCAEGILVALDPDYVGANLARAEATIAHEWGHVVQAQATEQDVDLDLALDPEGLPIDAELQADCFAGAWAAERARSPLSELRADVATTGDPHGVALDDPDAHGSAEERVEAFDLGAARGPAACVEDLVELLP